MDAISGTGHMTTDPAEPTFVIKAKDALAVPVIRNYYRECMEHGLTAQADEVNKALSEIVQWQKNHDVKFPDHKHRPHHLA